MLTRLLAIAWLGSAWTTSSGRTAAFMLFPTVPAVRWHRCRVAAPFGVTTTNAATAAGDTSDGDIAYGRGALFPPDESSARPTITLKVALDSAGGVDDLGDKDSFRFTCGASLDMVHRLRAKSDAVLVGVGTVVRDDCTLTVRRCPLPTGQLAQPIRVVMDRTLRTPPNSKLLHDGHAAVIFSDAAARPAAHDALYRALVGDGDEGHQSGEGRREGSAVTVVDMDTSTAKGLSQAMEYLQAEHGVSHVMVEGGPATASSFLLAGMIDRAIIVRATSVTFENPVPSGLDDEVLLSCGLEKLGQYALDVDIMECWSRPGLRWPESGLEEWP